MELSVLLRRNEMRRIWFDSNESTLGSPEEVKSLDLLLAVNGTCKSASLDAVANRPHPAMKPSNTVSTDAHQ